MKLAGRIGLALLFIYLITLVGFQNQTINKLRAQVNKSAKDYGWLEFELRNERILHSFAPPQSQHEDSSYNATRDLNYLIEMQEQTRQLQSIRMEMSSHAYDQPSSPPYYGYDQRLH